MGIIRETAEMSETERMAVRNSNFQYRENIVYIVESGTSGIWNYRKWSDGTAECWGVDTVSVTCTDAEGVYFSDSKSIALPSNLFNDYPVALAACGDNWCWVSGVKASMSAVYFKVTRGNPYDKTFSPGINLCVIGKWK